MQQKKRLALARPLVRDAQPLDLYVLHARDPISARLRGAS
jgi:hypothetical protein